MALGDHILGDAIRCTPLLAYNDALPDCQQAAAGDRGRQGLRICALRSCNTYGTAG
jgi:hypothetical protein